MQRVFFFLFISEPKSSDIILALPKKGSGNVSDVRLPDLKCMTHEEYFKPLLEILRVRFQGHQLYVPHH